MLKTLVLSEELQGLTDQLEEILHDQLPEVAHRTVDAYHDTDELKELRKVLRELENLQRVIGMKTYALLRLRPEIVDVKQTWFKSEDEAAEAGVEAPEPKPEPEPPPADTLVVPHICHAHPCGNHVGITACPHCKLPFCPKHHDPALHPCAGDSFE